MPDSIHWDYGNGDSLWIYNTETESHNGYTTYNAEGKYEVTLTEYYQYCSVRSKSYSIDVKKNDLGIAHIDKTNGGIVVSPNPANNLLYVVWADGARPVPTMDYTIYNVVGQVVLQGVLWENTSINIESLAKGMYYICLNRDFSKIFKISKIF